MRFFKGFKSLRSVLLIQVAVPVLLLLAIMLAVGLALVGQFIESRMQRDLQLVARTIHLPISQAIERRDLEQLQNSMASVFGITEVYGAYVFDKYGQRLSSFGAVNPTRQQATEALAQIVDGEFAQYERIRGRNVYSFFMPIFDATGQPNGLLQVTRRRSDIERELNELQYWAWSGFVLVSIIILGTLAFAHQRAIGRPMEQLLQSMQRVRDGEKAHRAEMQGPLEINELASGLNGMLDAIDAANARELTQREAREMMAEKLRQNETLAVLGQLSAGVAHELGAPLSVVDGRASRLMRRLPDATDQKELQEIKDQSARMTAIIQQLLSYGRSSRSEKRQLSVPSLVARAVALLDEYAGKITVKGGPDVTLYGESLGLEQALVNLLRNACQACPKGPVEILWQQDERYLSIMIDDAGEGIPDTLKAQIFEPFVTSKVPGQGSGLGLAIVKRVLRDHQASIALVDSQLGGACFQLRFPLNKQDEQQPNA
ncbi:sensor histidine kinase [Methylophaga sp. OBS3]|uniref:sensor histidine kinase n=1 Tax=Methylophaga sp. OBS3 TaxID=2991934 RepID=UPI002255B37A|nr:HAMP domain-containing sensor histidine kinase [Methylophaga sp. OBS3]MCX4189678.1 HAMP domain-containing histidine kinase [Methylophaga sp. OBS3]